MVEYGNQAFAAVKLRTYKRFIYVGVDISIYALLTGDCTHVLLSSAYVSLVLCYIALPTAQSCAVWDDNNKDDVCAPTIPAGLKCPPSSKTISLITWFEA